MPLVDMKDMLQHAYRHGYAVGAFDLVSLDFLEGIMADTSSGYTGLVKNISAHVAFADGWFWPVAGERISIDYQALESDG